MEKFKTFLICAVILTLIVVMIAYWGSIASRIILGYLIYMTVLVVCRLLSQRKSLWRLD